MSRISSLKLLAAAAALVVAHAAIAAPASKQRPVAVDAGTPDTGVVVREVPQLKIAVLSFTGVNIKPELLAFYTEHFGHALAARGAKVTTPAQVQALISVERQKQLLGCGENTEACMTELGNALGVDAIATGSIAVLDTTYRLQLRILGAASGELLSSGSQSLKGQNAVADELTRAAAIMSQLAASRAGRRLVIGQPVKLDVAPIQQPVVVTPPVAVTPPLVAPVSDGGTVTVAETPPTEVRPVAPPPRIKPPPVPRAPVANPRKLRITVAPFSVAFGVLGLELERGIADSVSVLVGVKMYYPAINLTRGLTFGFVGGLRFFPLKMVAPEGLWIGLEAELGTQNGTAVVGGSAVEYTLARAWPAIGYTFISKGGFTVSLGAGWAVGVGITANGSEILPLFGPTLHANLGWAF